MSASLLPLLVGLLLAGAVLLAAPARPVVRALDGPRPDDAAVPSTTPARSPGRRWWLPASAVAGGCLVVLPAPLGPAAAVVGAVLVRRALARAEAPAVRRAREDAARDLPHLVALLASALAAGAPTGRALDAVCDAWPGAAADRLAPTRTRLALGADPAATWAALAQDDVLGPLGRALARAAATGAPVSGAVGRLADDLDAASRAEVEDRARTVGVRAAVPLGLCLLPAFVLLGVVPLAVGLFSGLL